MRTRDLVKLAMLLPVGLFGLWLAETSIVHEIGDPDGVALVSSISAGVGALVVVLLAVRSLSRGR